jgi:pimeloyl-ACP methyl ester carboxylesterase
MTQWPSLAPGGKTLSLPGGEFFYYDCKSSAQGVKKPVLVLIHGLGDEADTWRYIIPLLCSKGYRCIAVDLPGFGRSIWRGKISIRRDVQVVLRLMAESGEISEKQPCVLIGSSMGSGIAEYAAFLKPELVQALILMDGCFPIPGGVGKGLFSLLLPGVGKRWYRSFRKNHEAAWKSLYAYYHDLEAMSDEDKKFLRERVIDRVESDNQERGYLLSLRSMIAMFMFKKGFFIRGLKRFKGKLFLIWGEHDNVMSVKNTSIFKALRPDAVLEIIAGAGHLPQQEKPQETAEAVLRFLEAV